jgi:hypothetical protein
METNIPAAAILSPTLMGKLPRMVLSQVPSGRSGMIRVPGAGWIDPGSDTPANGIRDQNTEGVKPSVFAAGDATGFQNFHRRYRHQTPP